jgi:signal transduction histidine kinase
MTRSLLGAVAVGADSAVLLATHRGWSVLAFAVIAAVAVALERRWAVAAFVVALALGAVTGAAFALLLWSSYRVGLALDTAPTRLVTAGAAIGALAAQLAVRPMPASQVGVFVIFVVLPLLVGRYLTQHRRLVATLRQRNLDLHRNQELVADRERLRERLRIARDVHDALGHRLSLVSVQAATLEVADLPAGPRQTVRQLAGAARSAMDDLHELVGRLRTAEATDDERSPGLDAVAQLVAGFAAAGVPVTLLRQGRAGVLATPAGQAAYRLVEEGLTNATKHAPGQPVTVSLTWEGETLLVAVSNPLPSTGEHGGPGHGLAGLRERVELAGGVLAARRTDEEGFRLFAMLPANADRPAAAPVERNRATALGWLVAGLVLGVLPALMLVGPVR